MVRSGDVMVGDQVRGLLMVVVVVVVVLVVVSLAALLVGSESLTN